MTGIRALVVSLSIVALTGCVAFESPPTTSSLGCDSTLAGIWREASSAGQNIGESDIQQGQAAPGEWAVSADCAVDQVRLGQYDPDLARGFDLSTFKSFEVDGKRYLAFEAESWLRDYDEHGRFLGEWPKHRVLVLRYALEGDTLDLWAPDHEALAELRSPGVRVRSLGPRYRTTESEDNEFTMSFGTEFLLSASPKRLERMLRERGDLLYPRPTMRLRRTPQETDP